jgi:hypothetical protein
LEIICSLAEIHVNIQKNIPNLFVQTLAGHKLKYRSQPGNRFVRFLPSKNYQFTSAKTTRLLTQQSSVIIQGEGTSAMAWISKAGVWAGGVNCLSAQSKQFFVGGSADVTSKSKLVVINAGLSSSIVDVITYSENNSFKKTITIGKNQTTSLSLVTLAPSAKAIAMQVIPRTGRVVSYLVDERVAGLKTLGGDVINSQDKLGKTLLIPGIAHNPTNKSHTLRVLNPGIASTVVTVEVLSKDGRYIPVGLDGRKIGAGKVADISFDFDSKLSSFGLRITSDQPIAASAYSRVGKDFVWSSAVTPNITGSWAITGLDPVMQFVGDQIKVKVTSLLPGKQKISSIISGTDFVNYQVPKNALGVRIDQISKGTAASILVTSQSGIGYMPLVNGSSLARSTVPTANIGVLNP